MGVQLSNRVVLTAEAQQLVSQIRDRGGPDEGRAEVYLWSIWRMRPDVLRRPGSAFLKTRKV
jgi:hypothetical protein